jgi:serine/threonine protein kinase
VFGSSVGSPLGPSFGSPSAPLLNEAEDPAGSPDPLAELLREGGVLAGGDLAVLLDWWRLDRRRGEPLADFLLRFGVLEGPAREGMPLLSRLRAGLSADRLSFDAGAAMELPLPDALFLAAPARSAEADSDEPPPSASGSLSASGPRSVAGSMSLTGSLSMTGRFTVRDLFEPFAVVADLSRPATVGSFAPAAGWMGLWPATVPPVAFRSDFSLSAGWREMSESALSRSRVRPAASAAPAATPATPAIPAAPDIITIEAASAETGEGTLPLRPGPAQRPPARPDPDDSRARRPNEPPPTLTGSSNDPRSLGAAGIPTPAHIAALADAGAGMPFVPASTGSSSRHESETPAVGINGGNGGQSGHAVPPRPPQTPASGPAITAPRPEGPSSRSNPKARGTGTGASGPGKRGRPKVGDRLGKCLLVEQVGKGASSIVFRAQHRTLDITVAVKVLVTDQAADPSVRKLLNREARLLARLDHPHIVRVLDYEDDGPFPYLILDFVEGMSLADLIQQSGRVHRERAVAIITQAAKGLAVASSIGIIHRDVKPANILVARDGTAKLTDLGLGAMTEGSTGESRHDLGLSSGKGTRLVGTVAYMSPEQATGGTTIDFRSDMYSLGATLYHAVCGRPPFTGTNPMEVMVKHVQEAPAPPEQLAPDVGRGLSAVILRMLEKTPPSGTAATTSCCPPCRPPTPTRSLPPAPPRATPAAADGASPGCSPCSAETRPTAAGATAETQGVGSRQSGVGNCGPSQTPTRSFRVRRPPTSARPAWSRWSRFRARPSTAATARSCGWSASPPPAGRS